jgi:hypothetical protein
MQIDEIRADILTRKQARHLLVFARIRLTSLIFPRLGYGAESFINVMKLASGLMTILKNGEELKDKLRKTKRDDCKTYG